MSRGEVGCACSRAARIGALVCLGLGLLLAGNAVAQAPLAADACKTTQARSVGTDITIALDPATSWQPRGGEVRGTVESKTQPIKDVDVMVCFRWSSTDAARDKAADWTLPAPIRVVEIGSSTAPGKAIFSVTVPNLDRVKSSWFDRLRGNAVEAGNQPDQFDNGMMVPVADMKVVVARSNAIVTTAVLEVGITSVWTAILTTLACILGAHAVLYAWASYQNVPGKSPWMRIISTRDGYASLSQMQIMLWSFVFGAGAVYVMSLSGSLINIPTGALVLLGIAGATTVGAKIQGANAQAAAPTPPARAALPTATADPAAPTNFNTIATTSHSVTLNWNLPTAGAVPAVHAVSYAEQALANWRTSDDRIVENSHRVSGLLPATMYVFRIVALNSHGASPPVEVAKQTDPASGRKPQWSDLVVSPQSPGVIDVTRVQMLFFTLISAGFVAIKLINSYMIPDIPDGFMLLMGISNGVYLSAKFVPD